MSILKETIAVTGILVASTIYSCTDDRQTTNYAPSNTVQSMDEQKLRNATEIVIDEKVLCWGKEYGIYVNSEKVATLEGKDINWWEDRFILKTVDGKILETENENKRIMSFNRSASFYDGDGKINGYMAEHTWQDLLNWNHIFHIYDANQNEVGKTEKKAFTLLDKIELYDMQGNIDYVSKQKLTLIGDKYLLTVLDPNSIIPVEKAITLTCIEDAIKDAKQKESSD